MRIQSIPWPPDRVEHLARHNVTPDEVDQSPCSSGSPGQIGERLQGEDLSLTGSYSRGEIFGLYIYL
jgi:hypothetical protein